LLTSNLQRTKRRQPSATYETRQTRQTRQNQTGRTKQLDKAKGRTSSRPTAHRRPLLLSTYKALTGLHPQREGDEEKSVRSFISGSFHQRGPGRRIYIQHNTSCNIPSADEPSTPAAAARRCFFAARVKVHHTGPFRSRVTAFALFFITPQKFRSRHHRGRRVSIAAKQALFPSSPASVAI
jgi:hypothetical protein